MCYWCSVCRVAILPPSSPKARLDTPADLGLIPWRLSVTLIEPRPLNMDGSSVSKNSHHGLVEVEGDDHVWAWAVGSSVSPAKRRWNATFPQVSLHPFCRWRQHGTRPRGRSMILWGALASTIGSARRPAR
jgi:hypothetical protein